MGIEQDLTRGDIIKIFKEINTTFYNKYVSKDIKILHISDIHYSGIKNMKRLNFLYEKLSKYKVDYICITGDLIDSNNIIENSINYSFILGWLKKLTNISKVLISLGNHDIFTRIGKDLKKLYNKQFWNDVRNIDNIYLLDNESYRDDSVYVFGYTQSFNYYYKKKDEDKNIMLKEIDKYNVTKVPNNKLKICLMHSPICLQYKDIEDRLNCYDLILSGHMHNGMIPPIIDELFDNNIGLIAPNKKLFPKTARGILIKDNITIISPGITKLHNTVSPLIRWGNIFFPIGINVIDISNDKCDVKKSYKYHK